MAAFAAARDWDQFHSPRNLVLAMVGEVGELAEMFQWKPDGSCPPGLAGWKDEKLVHLGEEMADVLLYLVRLADRCGIDLPMAAARKLQINGIKYPAETVRGRSEKYNEYKQNWREKKRTRGNEEAVAELEQPAAKKEKREERNAFSAAGVVTGASPGVAATKKRRIVMVGLDGAGKTSVLYRLKLGKGAAVTTVPTVGFNVEMVAHHGSNTEFDIWDVGGSKDKRSLWHQFYENTDGIVFVVDDAPARIVEARQVLERVLTANDLKGVPLLLLANKKQALSDYSKRSAGGGVARSAFAAVAGAQARERQVRFQPVSAASGDGLDEALDWLARAISSGC